MTSLSESENAGSISGLSDIPNGTHRRHYDLRGSLDYDFSTRDAYDWRHDGKLSRQRSDANAPGTPPTPQSPDDPLPLYTEYGYDAQGNRLSRSTLSDAFSDTDDRRYAELRTVHVRDASGQVLATYKGDRAFEQNAVPSGDNVYQPIAVHRPELPTDLWRYPTKAAYALSDQDDVRNYDSWYDWVRRVPEEQLRRFADETEWDNYVAATGSTPEDYDSYDAYESAIAANYRQGGGTAEGSGPEVYLSEVPLYGSSRIGVRQYSRRARSVAFGSDTPSSPEGVVPVRTGPIFGATAASQQAGHHAFGERGMNRYEISNHLGNVLAVVSDFRQAADGRMDGQQSGFASTTYSTREYYPFGLEVPDKSRETVRGASNEYRYGFNGKEDDPYLGRGSIQDYGFRLYERASGRFLSVDPLTRSYPMLTPYQFAGNSPIWLVDEQGRSPKSSTAQVTGDPRLNYSALNANSNYSGLTVFDLRAQIREVAAGALEPFQVNMAAGYALEDAYRQFTGMYQPGNSLSATGDDALWPRITRPDFLHPTTVQGESGRILTYMFGGVVEVKTSQNDVTLKTSTNQIDAELNMARFAPEQSSVQEIFGDQPPRAAAAGAASLTLVLPHGGVVGEDIVDAAKRRNVNLYVQYAFQENGSDNVVFSNPQQLHKAKNSTDAPAVQPGNLNSPGTLNKQRAVDRYNWSNDHGADKN